MHWTGLAHGLAEDSRSQVYRVMSVLSLHNEISAETCMFQSDIWEPGLPYRHTKADEQAPV